MDADGRDGNCWPLPWAWRTAERTDEMQMVDEGDEMGFLWALNLDSEMGLIGAGRTADGLVWVDGGKPPLLDAVDEDKGEGAVMVASPDLPVAGRDGLRSKWIRNQLVFAVIMHGLDWSSAPSPELSSPAAMAAGLEGEDGVPYGCSGGVLKTVNMQ
ncbi:hypothetical protein ACLOJK_000659 [Asimina triloba]